jgi:hypothetical protein
MIGWKRIIGLIILIIHQSLTAHTQINIAKYEIGAGIGAFVYQGDLTPSASGSYRTMKPAINLFGSKILSPSFLLRTNLAFGKLKGDDALYDHPEYRQQRNFNFRSPVFEISELIVWNPLGTNYRDNGLSPYLFTGAGVSFLKIKRDWSNFNAAYFGETSDLPARISVDAAHKLPKVIPVLPVGLGLRYGLTSRIAVNAEASYRFVFTDYLDGFSTAANPSKGDHYNSISVGAIYRIGKKNMLDCPKIRY